MNGARIGLDTDVPRARPIEANVRIGLEIHVYANTRAKMFCACPADAIGARPNTNVCETCTGQPGARPMAPNAEALRIGVRVARALGCRILPSTRFLRKHYWYPDLPSNYQRTSEPFAVEGSVALQGRVVRIREVHWEEDPGAYDLDAGTVDYGRSGLPLLEIVTEPDLRSPEDVRAFLRELALALGYLDAWREAAGVKADVNVSLEGGERVEIKNVSGFRAAERAAAGEVARQLAEREAGRPVRRETRGFDDATGATTRLRSKEEAVDYRFLPDPDLPPVAGYDALAPVEESPFARRARLAALAGVDVPLADALVEERTLADAFEKAAAKAPPRVAFEFVVRDLRGDLRNRGLRLSASRVTADEVASLVEALAAGRVTAQAATRILREGLDQGGLATLLAAETQAGPSAEDEVRVAAENAVAENPKAVADYRAGKEPALNFIVGQAMKRLRGRGRPDDVRKAVLAALERNPCR